MTTKLYIRKPNGRYIQASKNLVTDLVHQWAVADMAKRDYSISGPVDSFDAVRRAVGNQESENFVVLFLDNRHRLINATVMFTGTIDGTSVYPREVVKRALEFNAAAVILGHNHPSGICEPSNADERITKRLKKALELVDVRLLDHIIVARGTDNYTSLAHRGLI